jgi:hypothetical protein
MRPFMIHLMTYDLALLPGISRSRVPGNPDLFAFPVSWGKWPGIP